MMRTQCSSGMAQRERPCSGPALRYSTGFSRGRLAAFARQHMPFGAASSTRHAPASSTSSHASSSSSSSTSTSSSGRPSTRCQSSETAVASTSPYQNGVPKAGVWEIDFCSRPLLDERGKKVWELLICDPERTFEYSQYFPNSKINSAELRRAIEAILSQEGAERPDRARFFRGQMQTIMSKALNEVGIKPVPSRRCFSIMGLLQERLDNVYKQDPRYSDKATSLFNLDLGSPEPLPDALRGEKWAFVQLPLGPLMQMLRKVEAGDMFGSTFSLSSAGCADLPSDILIPGVAVFSRRALPLAAWTNGLEIAGVKADIERSSLILETGVNARWRYGGWRPSPDSIEEAEGWEEAKQGVKGLHFLAVQPDPDTEELNGLWLLQDRMPPSI